MALRRAADLLLYIHKKRKLTEAVKSPGQNREWSFLFFESNRTDWFFGQSGRKAKKKKADKRLLWGE